MAATSKRPNVIASDEDWEFELDIMGRNVPLATLQKHLERAPDPGSPGARMLAGYISGVQQHA